MSRASKFSAGAKSLITYLPHYPLPRTLQPLLGGSWKGPAPLFPTDNEGLAVFARDALEDDGEGDFGARRTLLPIVSEKIKTSSSKSSKTQKIVL